MTARDGLAMEVCCGKESAGRDTCELPPAGFGRAPRHRAMCPECQEVGKPVATRTVQAMLAVSLRLLTAHDYFFCRTASCPVVYFAAGDAERYGVKDVRERVFQKEPDAEDVFVCYCFRHRVGEFRSSSDQERQGRLQDIRDGISTEQCACDMRNPQGSCCLGNVMALARVLGSAAA